MNNTRKFDGTGGDDSVLFGQEHVEAYRETDGEVGHEWKPGVHALLLTTTGRRSGEPHTVALTYGRDGDDYVLIASKAAADEHPDWYLNLRADPHVEIQVGDTTMEATAQTATGQRRRRLWSMMQREVSAEYDKYAAATDRTIPVVVLTPDG